MQSNAKKLGIMFSLLLVFSLLLGCAQTGTEAPEEAQVGGGIIDEIQERGTLRMAIYALAGDPNQRRNEETGEIEGYFADVGRLLAKDLGVEPEFLDLEWKAIIPSVISGQADIIIAAPSATPERALSVDFPAIIAFYDSAAMVHMDGPYKTMEDLKQPGVRIAVNMGTTHHMLAQNQYPDAELIVFEGGTGAAAMEIASDRADVGFTNIHNILVYMEEFPFIRPVRDVNGEVAVLAREAGALTIAQGDQRFYNWLVNWERWYREQGILDAMYSKWMGPTLARLDDLPE